MSPSIAMIVTRQYAPHNALSVTLNQTRQRKGITGMIITAAISAEFLRPMPRYSIHVAIGRLMPAAMTSSRRHRVVTGSRLVPRHAHDREKDRCTCNHADRHDCQHLEEVPPQVRALRGVLGWS